MIVQTFHVDVGQRLLRSVNDDLLQVSDVRLVRGDTRTILVFKFRQWNGTDWVAFPIDAGAAMSFIIKQSTTRKGDALVFSDAAAWDVSGDSALVNRATGILSVRVNCNTTALTTLFATADAYKDLVGEIQMTYGGVTSTLCQFDLRMVHDLYQGDEGATVEGGPSYYTTGQVDGLLAPANGEFKIVGTKLALWDSTAAAYRVIGIEGGELVIRETLS